MTLHAALDRTLRLMRDEFGNAPPDEKLIDALTSTSIALVADEANIRTHSAQCCYVTAAMLMARSGHHVTLVAPNAELVGAQPPLSGERLIDGLAEVGRDMLPGIGFAIGPSDREFDLAIVLGDVPARVRARRTIGLNADRWSGTIQPDEGRRRWAAGSWPFGALAAAGLGADEAFKVAMRRLLPFAVNRELTAAVFAETLAFTFQLAPDDTPCTPEFGDLDCVSGGAITNAALYCLARIPNVRGRGRIIEPETAAVDNLNRYLLLRRSSAEREEPKAQDLARQLSGTNLRFEPIPVRFEDPTSIQFAPTVLVGVDHIPTRWAVQRSHPDCLAIGATTHWSAMASFHARDTGCAQCLHPEDDPTDEPIPTAACVSFWAGLLTAAYLARHPSGQFIPLNERQIYLTPFRPEKTYRAPVPIRSGCPSCNAGP